MIIQRTEQQPNAVGNISPESDDSDVLNLGVSVTLNDDLRRTLVAEDDEISKSLKKLMEATNVETKIQEQALKDHTHANNEMNELKTNAAETLDVMKTNEQFRLGLESTLKSQIKSSKNPQDPDTVSQAKEDVRMDEEGRENVAPTAPTSLSAIRKAYSKHCDFKRQLNGEVETYTKVLCSLRDEKKAVKESNVAAGRQENGLEQKWAKLMSDISYQQQECEKEGKRIVALKATKEAFLARQKELAKQEKELDKALSLKQNADTAKEAEMLKRLAAIEEDERRKAKILADREAELSEKMKQTGEVKMQCDEASLISKSCKEMKAKREHERAERKKLYSQKVEGEAEMTVFKDKLNKSNSVLLKYNEDLANIEEEKEANDKFEAEKILPAKSEANDIAKEKEQILDVTEAALEALNNDEMIKAAKEHKKEVREMTNKVLELEDELESKQSTRHELLRILDDQEDAYEKATLERDEFKKKTEDSIAGEQGRIGDHEKYKKARSAKRKDDELFRKNQVLEYGAEVVRASKMEERKIANRDDLDHDL